MTLSIKIPAILVDDVRSNPKIGRLKLSAGRFLDSIST